MQLVVAWWNFFNSIGFVIRLKLLVVFIFRNVPSKPYLSIEKHNFFPILSKNQKCVNQRVDNSRHQQSNRLTLFDFKVRWSECERKCGCASIGLCLCCVCGNISVESVANSTQTAKLRAYGEILQLNFFSSLLFIRYRIFDAVALMLVFFALHIHTHTHAAHYGAVIANGKDLKCG